jgi:hypothetical protein
MTKRISTEAKSARQKIRLVSKETERLINRVIRVGSTGTVITSEMLRTQVALNLKLPISDVEAIVMAYVGARDDLYIYPDKGGIVRRPQY